MILSLLWRPLAEAGGVCPAVDLYLKADDEELLNWGQKSGI